MHLGCSLPQTVKLSCNASHLGGIITSQIQHLMIYLFYDFTRNTCARVFSFIISLVITASHCQWPSLSNLLSLLYIQVPFGTTLTHSSSVTVACRELELEEQKKKRAPAAPLLSVREKEGREKSGFDEQCMYSVNSKHVRRSWSSQSAAKRGLTCARGFLSPLLPFASPRDKIPHWQRQLSQGDTSIFFAVLSL